MSIKSIVKNEYFWVGVIATLHVLVLLQLIFFPYPELFIYAHLTQKGLVPYKQIFDQHFPGAMFLPVNLFTLGVVNPERIRIVHLGIAVLNDILFYKISNNILRSRLVGIISLGSYVFWQVFFEGHVLWIESFITPILLGVFIFLTKYEKRQDGRYLRIVFLLLSLATIFKQTAIPLVGLTSLYLVFKLRSLKKLILPFAIYLAPVGLVLLYFVAKKAFGDFIYWTFTFNFTVFSEMGRTYPKLTDLAKTLPVFGMAAFMSIYIFLKKKNTQYGYAYAVIYFFGSLFFAFARYDPIHLQPAIPFAILLIFIGVKNYFRNNLLFYAGLICYLVFSLCIFGANFRSYNKPGYLPMYNDTETLDLVNYFSKQPKETTVFALGTHPHIYYLLDKTPPGDVFVFQFPWFMRIAEGKILDGLQKDPPDFVLRNQRSSVGGYKLIEYMTNINLFVGENYRSVDVVGSVEVLGKI